MKKKRLSLFAMVLGLMLVVTGCGSASMDMAVTESMSTGSSKGNYNYSSDVFYEDSVLVEEEKMESATTSASESGKVDVTVETERKLIKTVDMNVETKEFDQMMNALEDKVAELGGYIENMDVYNGSSYSSYRSARNADLTVRIPKQKLNAFLETVEGISNVVRSSERVEDVTLTYVDLESHKQALLTEQERLLALLGKAESIEDIITIENRLSNVRYQIESMESQLRTYDNKIDYSTVYLNVEEVQELTPVAEQTTLERIAEGFSDSLEEIRDGLVDFAVWFVVNIPYFVLWIIVLIVVVLGFKLGVKVVHFAGSRKKEKKEINPSKETE